MHEYSIVLALMERIEAEVAARGAVAVHRVRLRIGALSGVEPVLLESAFSLVREHTMCEGAALDIERVPASWCCLRCDRSIAAGDTLQCPDCNEPARLQGGDEILLDQLELEVP